MRGWGSSSSSPFGFMFSQAYTSSIDSLPYNVAFPRLCVCPMLDFVVLACAAFLAGLVDAVVGGGGLIQIPAIFAVFPKEVPATLLGTNKLASMCGTSVAAVKYARRVQVAWSTAAPAAIAAFALAFVGAWTVTRVPADF